MTLYLRAVTIHGEPGVDVVDVHRHATSALGARALDLKTARSRIAVSAETALDWWENHGLEQETTWKRALLCFLLLSAATVMVGGLNYDVAWHLYSAQRIVAGDRLYVDILEYNPPLVYYLNVPLAKVASWLPFSTRVSSLLVLALALLPAIGLAFRVLQAMDSILPLFLRRLFFLTTLYLAFAWVGDSFGQREHLAVVFTLAYLLALCCRISMQPISGKLALSAGLMGAVGFSLKPQFFLVWLLCEGYVCWRARTGAGVPIWKRPETLAVMAFALLYGLGSLVFFPEYLALVKMAARTYSNFDLSPAKTLSYTCSLPLVAVVAYLLTESSPLGRPIRRLLLLATLGFLAGAISYMKGWPYHFIPAQFVAGLLLVVILGSLVSRDKRQHQAFASMLLILLLVWGFAGRLQSASYSLGVWEFTDEGRLSLLLKKRAEGLPVVFYSTSIFPAFPCVNLSGARWAMHFPFLWILPGLYPEGYVPRSPQDMNALERNSFDTVVTDFLQQTPTVVVVDDRVRKQGFAEAKFDFLTYYQQDPRFARQWQHYKLDQIVGAYRVYVFRDPTWVNSQPEEHPSAP